MKKRIGLAGIYHETNTFSKQPTDLEHFKKAFWLEEEAILKEYRGAHHEISGVIEVLEQREDYELVPIFYASATPSGIVTREAYNAVLNRLLELFDQNGPYDGLIVLPHGAGVTEEHPDMDGHWMQRLRERLGPNIPITGTLDPHANVSPQMVNATDGLFPYQTNPHIDQARVGSKAAQMMIDRLSGNKMFYHQLIQLPVAISIEQQYTSESPCLDLLHLLETKKETYNLYALSLLLGFPYADVPELGSAFIAISENPIPKKLEEELKDFVYDNLDQYNGQKRTIDDLIPQFENMEKPILLLDMGDNVGGGSSAQSTHLLEALDRAGLDGTFICIYDPKAVQQLKEAEETPDRLTIGENGYLIQPKNFRLIDGKFKELTPKHGGFVNYNMGDSAIVHTTNGQTIMLTSLRTVPFSLQQLLAYELQPEQFNFIVAKGVNAPIAAYKDVCKHLVKVDTPGDTSADMTRFTFHHRRKPLFPFERPNKSDFQAC